ncbi:formate dehydrogenase accessory sulfurtransferase FdhD [Longimicrobium sp.]|uniref:formate dehydrogenase accessory sulfurtransferase FdhD n=1 Tax=Longimicrobium sp. TaxID=2029185 RepID=UPI002E2FA969|nr:formate dehydrogenase accessory sulfurtransferase FdhD [Longimicrobium sp.]HEX6037304.1 formate dehydrogenase accessory sulfurtransferase FdhD [Longimicrobium sp.]
MRPGSTARRRIERIRVDGAGVDRRTRDDLLAVEEPLEIRLVRAEDTGRAEEAATRVAVTMRTPGADFELAAGFLYSEGLIDGPDSIGRIRYCTDAPQQYNTVSVHLAPGADFDPSLLSRNFYATSSCGVCGKASIDAVMGPACTVLADGFTVDAGLLVALPDRLREAQRVFERTGGLHGAAQFTPDGTLVRAREDVGRHNALDKLVGAALLEHQLPLAESIVLVSGRLSFELVQKAARAGVPVLAGVSAPSSLAVRLADEAGMTLAGFVRDGGFNVYAGGGRIVHRTRQGVGG